MKNYYFSILDYKGYTIGASIAPTPQQALEQWKLKNYPRWRGNGAAAAWSREYDADHEVENETA